MDERCPRLTENTTILLTWTTKGNHTAKTAWQQELLEILRSATIPTAYREPFSWFNGPLYQRQALKQHTFMAARDNSSCLKTRVVTWTPVQWWVK